MASRRQRDAFYDSETATDYFSNTGYGSNIDGYPTKPPYQPHYSSRGASARVSNQNHCTVGDLRRQNAASGGASGTHASMESAASSRGTFALAVQRDQELTMARWGRGTRGQLSTSPYLPSMRPAASCRSAVSSFDYRSSSPSTRSRIGGGGEPDGLMRDAMGYTSSDRYTDSYYGGGGGSSYEADVPSLILSESSNSSSGGNNASGNNSADPYIYSPCQNTSPKHPPEWAEPHHPSHHDRHIQHMHEDYCYSGSGGAGSVSDWDGDRKPSARPTVTHVRYGMPPSLNRNSSKGDKINKENKLQVSPGQFVRLIGAEETWDAIQRDQYMPCVCLGCDLALCCVLEASLVICPDCRIISPLDKGSESESDHGEMGGVGLGFKLEALAEWQEGLLREYS